MRRLSLMVAALATAVATAWATPAAADPAFEVSLVACKRGGGSLTVPAGQPLLARVGWVARTRGLVENFLHGSTTLASVDGTPVADAEAFYSEPQPGSLGGLSVWFTVWRLPLTALDPGESVHIRFDLFLDRPMVDLLVFEGNHPAILEPGLIFGVDCTLTGSPT